MKGFVDKSPVTGLMIGSAIALAALSGWGALHSVDVLAAMGLIGAMAMILVDGAHDFNFLGKAVFVLVNAFVYYSIIRAVLYLMSRRKNA